MGSTNDDGLGPVARCVRAIVFALVVAVLATAQTRGATPANPSSPGDHKVVFDAERTAAELVNRLVDIESPSLDRTVAGAWDRGSTRALATWNAIWRASHTHHATQAPSLLVAPKTSPPGRAWNI